MEKEEEMKGRIRGKDEIKKERKCREKSIIRSRRKG